MNMTASVAQQIMLASWELWLPFILLLFAVKALRSLLA